MIYKPKYHFTPSKNWINDPVGLCYYDGLYHMYYQYFPYGCEWGTMHWGHATSKDLFEWEEAEVALFPTLKADQNGVFSGTAFIENGELNLFYTGVEYVDANSQNIHVYLPEGKFISSQLRISSKDAFNFDNYNDKEIVLGPIEDESIGSKMHTRDPLVIKENDYYYMFLGTQVDNKSKLLVYRSKSLSDFQLYLEYELDNLGTMLECPSIAKFENESYLLFSPENYNTDQVNYPSNAGYMKLNAQLEKKKIALVNDFKLLDHGYDIYAAQAFEDKNLNQVYIAWVRTPKTLPNYNYRGLMTYPRILMNGDNCLLQKVHPNINEKFKYKCEDFDENMALKFTLALRNGENIKIAGVDISMDNNILQVDRSKVFGDYEQISNKFTLKLNDSAVELEIYYDLHIIEIYVNDGQYVITNYLERVDNEFLIDLEKTKVLTNTNPKI